MNEVILKSELCVLIEGIDLPGSIKNHLNRQYVREMCLQYFTGSHFITSRDNSKLSRESAGDNAAARTGDSLLCTRCGKRIVEKIHVYPLLYIRECSREVSRLDRR